jgi:NAD(P)-dependent dehydrogenase (short-subunit alcohol dehydrogenase family)
MSEDMQFRDKICVITGGALGIGRCLTREFAKAGAKVAFADMEKQAGEENLVSIQNYGEGLFFHGDIAEKETLSAFAEQVIQKYGRVDFLINNACLSKRGILKPCSYEDFNYVLRVGVTAPYLLTQLFLPYFTKGAAIVNISSSRAFMSQSDTESYTAAKGGILALTHGLAVSLAGKVRVNSIAPGWIDTGAYHDESYRPEYTEADVLQHPSGRIGTPMDIARAVFFLCEEQNSFINGENITVDGGMTKQMIYSGDEGWEYRSAGNSRGNI